MSEVERRPPGRLTPLRMIFVLIGEYESLSPGTRLVPRHRGLLPEAGQSFLPEGEVEGVGSEIVVGGDTLAALYWSTFSTISQTTSHWKGLIICNPLEFHKKLVRSGVSGAAHGQHRSERGQILGQATPEARSTDARDCASVRGDDQEVEKAPQKVGSLTWRARRDSNPRSSA